MLLTVTLLACSKDQVRAGRVAGGGWELLTVGERKEGGSEGDVSEGDVSEGGVSEGGVSEGDVSEGDVSEGGVSEGVGASGELGKWKICRLGRITGLD